MFPTLPSVHSIAKDDLEFLILFSPVLGTCTTTVLVLSTSELNPRASARKVTAIPAVLHPQHLSNSFRVCYVTISHAWLKLKFLSIKNYG